MIASLPPALVDETLRPAFASTRGALGYCALVGVALLSPVLLSHAPGASDPRLAYEEMPIQGGAFPFIERQTFDETSDIDLLFLGSSSLLTAIDTPYVRDEASRRLGRPATVLTFGVNFRGEEIYYTLLRNVLAHRRVGTVVLQLPSATQTSDVPWMLAHHLMPAVGAPALWDGLPLRYRVPMYAESVLGAPRRALSLLRPEAPQPLAQGIGVDLGGVWFPSEPRHAELGNLFASAGFEGAPFVAREGAVPDVPAERLIYGPATRDRFRLGDVALTPLQAHFVDRLFALVRDHGVRAVALHVPPLEEHDDDRVEERLDWSAHYGASIVGIPARELFGADHADVRAYYYNTGHLNANGAALFTRAIAPAILQLAFPAHVDAPR
jgi:hypothetical protein